jgi:hypothetical protein
MSIRVFFHHNLGRIPMSTSVDVNVPSASITMRPEDRRAKDGTTVVIGLLIAVGLVLFAVGNIYLNALVGPMDLPFLGQFFGS